MTREKSGRLIIEIDSKSKKNLYHSLAKIDISLNDRFLIQAEENVKNSDQIKLFN